MKSRPRTKTYLSAQSTGATFNGPWTPVLGTHMSAEISWTDTTNGTIKLQTQYAGGTGRDVPGAAAEFTANGNAQPAGSASAMVVNFEDVPGSMFRFVFTRSSGSGAMTIQIVQR